MNKNTKELIRTLIIPMIAGLAVFVFLDKAGLTIVSTIEGKTIISVMVFLHFQTRRSIREMLEETEEEKNHE